MDRAKKRLATEAEARIIEAQEQVAKDEVSKDTLILVKMMMKKR
jgi:hypothetical protein